MKKYLYSLAAKKCLLGFLMLVNIAGASAADKLSGTPIGTERCFNFETNREIPCAASNLFDGNYNTYFATVESAYTWGGLDLGAPCVISRIGWAPRAVSSGAARMILGMFQGANRADFLDAVPLYLITTAPTSGQMNYADIDCSLGFRYVRYVGPSGSQCAVSELEFYGTPGVGDKTKLPQFSLLPVVSINTVNSKEPFDKETDIVGYTTIIDKNKVNTEASMTIRERGNASRDFPKKPWRLKFDKKQRPLGATAKAKKWTLINNYGDKSLIRNLVAFEMAKRLKMEYVPYGEPVDVVLNGEYKGTYQLCDQVEVGEGRVPVEEMAATDIEGEALSGGYLVEIDAYADQEPAGEWFYADYGLPVTIKSPDPGVTQQFDYIRNYISSMVRSVLSVRNSDTAPAYREIIDIDSFLKHFIVGELAANTDTYWSTYMYKFRGNPKLYTGPVWDFDLGFDNDKRTYPVNSMKTYLYDSGVASSAAVMKNLVDKIIKTDLSTKGDIKRIWSQARNSYDLTAESLCNFVDSLAERVSDSQQLNFMRWPVLRQYVHMNPRVPANYAAEITFMKNYLQEAFKRLDPLMYYDPSYTDVEEIAQPCNLNFTISKRSISSEIDSHFSVYATDGRLVFSGTGETPQLAKGVYIIRVGNQSYRVML